MKLDLDVAERTVSRLISKRRPPPSQTWRTFLTNHVRDLASLDVFTVPTPGLRVLFVLVVLASHRRRVVHFNVTEHPTAHWTTQQIVDAFPHDTRPSSLLRDRDHVDGPAFPQRVKGLSIQDVLTTPASPWQNPFAERLIGAIRRVPGSCPRPERPPPAPPPGTRLLGLSRGANSPRASQANGRPIERPDVGTVVQSPEVGGLHHRDVRQAA